MPSFVTEGPVTKSYVDTTAQGLHVLTPVKAATTGNISIASALNDGATIDGITLSTDDRVLVKNQTDAEQNGIYEVGASPDRTTDFNHTGATGKQNVRIGDFVFCEGGTTNAGHGFVMTGSANFNTSGTGGSVDTDPIVFTQFSGLTNTVAVNQGGTGATSAAAAAAALGVGTGNNVQFNSLGVGAAGSGTTGEIRATNDITAYYSSDKRLKTNIKPIQNPLSKLQNVGGYTFEWIPKEGIHSHEGDDIGVIAQEIEEVLPELTTTRDNGYKAVKYEKLTAFLLECVKEQQQQINSLSEKIKSLEKNNE